MRSEHNCIQHFELVALLEQAAQKGATEALARLGLQDDDAGQDIHALRDLIRLLRHTRMTFLTKIVSAMATALLILVALGLGKWMLSLGVIPK